MQIRHHAVPLPRSPAGVVSAFALIRGAHHWMRRLPGHLRRGRELAPRSDVIVKQEHYA